jgi:hypothetical protein
MRLDGWMLLLKLNKPFSNIKNQFALLYINIYFKFHFCFVLFFVINQQKFNDTNFNLKKYVCTIKEKHT